LYALLWHYHALHNHDDRISCGYPGRDIYALPRESIQLRRSLVKETLLLLEHAKEEIARQYAEGNGIVSKEVIDLEEYVEDLQRNYRF